MTDLKHRMLALALVGLGLLLASCSSQEALDRADLSEQPLVGKFVWHDLITDDVEAARQFYGELFDWQFEDTTRPGGGDYTLIRSHGRYIGGMVHLDDPQNDEYSRWLAYLSVEDVDRSAGFNEKAGGETVVGPVQLGNVGRAAAVMDPQGAVLGLIRSDIGDPMDVETFAQGQVVWNELLAEDAEQAGSFYADLASMGVNTISRRGGEYRILTSQGRERAGILQRPSDDIQPTWLTHFSVPDASKAAEQAADLGGKVLLDASPELREGGLAVISDPSGALLALHRWPDQGGN